MTVREVRPPRKTCDVRIANFVGGESLGSAFITKPLDHPDRCRTAPVRGLSGSGLRQAVCDRHYDAVRAALED